jgi:hypothetical protein
VTYPQLLRLGSEAAYRSHFERIYCKSPIATFDKIQVRFHKRDFDHCCFESSLRNKTKDQFSQKRARRLEWIKAALEDPNSERYQGYDRRRDCYDPKRRVAVVMGNYVVIIALQKGKRANFVTAFVADTSPPPGRMSTLDSIKNSPLWT